MKPAALVRAWLSLPGIAFRGGRAVVRIEPVAQDWRAVDAGGVSLAQAPLVVVCAAHASAGLLDPHGAFPLPLHPVRGQVSWGWNPANGGLPLPVINGHGHLLPRVPHAHGNRQGTAWFVGATYRRGETDCALRAQDQQANLDRLRALAPGVGEELQAAFTGAEGWAGVRCASRDRRPLVGPIAPGLWLSTALGSRGLSFALLCAHVMAARLHDEPLPAGSALAGALGIERVSPGRGRAAG